MEEFEDPAEAEDWAATLRDEVAVDCWQSVVKVPRLTESGDAPGWQGATREHTGSIRPL